MDLIISCVCCMPYYLQYDAHTEPLSRQLDLTKLSKTPSTLHVYV